MVHSPQGHNSQGWLKPELSNGMPALQAVAQLTVPQYPSADPTKTPFEKTLDRIKNTFLPCRNEKHHFHSS